MCDLTDFAFYSSNKHIVVHYLSTIKVHRISSFDTQETFMDCIKSKGRGKKIASLFLIMRGRKGNITKMCRRAWERVSVRVKERERQKTSRPRK